MRLWLVLWVRRSHATVCLETQSIWQVAQKLLGCGERSMLQSLPTGDWYYYIKICSAFYSLCNKQTNNLAKITIHNVTKQHVIWCDLFFFMLSLGVKGVNGEGKGEVKNEFERGKSVFLLPSRLLPPTSPSSSVSTPPLPLPHFTPAMQANGPREKNIPTFYNFFFFCILHLCQ